MAGCVQTNNSIEPLGQITVKPEISACPLFREFRDPGKFAKITGREYSKGNSVYCITGISASKNAKIKGAKIIS